MKKILMCPPDYFGIEYSINPWMNTSNGANSDSSVSQWQKLKQTYLDLGYEVVEVKPEKGLPDMVYVDVGVLYKNIFIPSNFRFKERQPESKFFEKAFKDLGFEIKNIPSDYYFEGHGDTLWSGNKLFFGYGFRSSIEAQYQIKNILGNEADLVPVELTDERFYHLDTCFCPADENTALCFTDAVSKKALKLLEEKTEIISVSEEDALKFACNTLIVDKNAIIPEGSSKVNKVLENLGFSVYEIPMSEFIKGGGACKCLSMLLN